MDEVIIKQLTRQLKLLNFWVTFFGVLFLATFVVAGIFLYKAAVELRHAEGSLTSFQQKAEANLNLQSKLCDSTGSVTTLLKKQTDVCN